MWSLRHWEAAKRGCREAREGSDWTGEGGRGNVGGRGPADGGDERGRSRG